MPMPCTAKVLWTARGIARHDAALQMQQAQAVGNGRACIGLRLDFAWAQAQPIDLGSRAHHMHSLLGGCSVVRAAKRFAIDGDDGSGGGPASGLGLGEKPLDQFVRIEARQNPPERLGRGNAGG